MNNKIPFFPNLEGEIVRRGIKKEDIASALGITGRAFRNKLNGSSPLTWPQADYIQKRFFPDKDKDYLYSRTA